MRIVLTENCTVDGVTDMSGGSFDPASQDDEVIDELRRQMAEEVTASWRATPSP